MNPNRTMTVTLKAAHFKNAGTLAFFPSWISNGHWAIRRGLVANSASFATVETISAAFPKIETATIRGYEADELMSDLQKRTGKDARTWTATALSWRNPADKSDCVIFTSGERHVLVNRAYLEMLPTPPTVLYGPANGPLADEPKPEQQSLVVMPVRGEDDDRHFVPLVAVVRAIAARGKGKAADEHAA